MDLIIWSVFFFNMVAVLKACSKGEFKILDSISSMLSLGHKDWILGIPRQQRWGEGVARSEVEII